MIKELAKVYDPSVVEERLYTKWCEKKYFHAEVDKSKKPFSIVMPPPNITGQLHMGHALDNTIQDILIRWKRMSGYNTLWVPGIDHASISTEVKVVAQIAKEGLKKEDLGREGFLKRCWQWKEQYGGIISDEQKRIAPENGYNIVTTIDAAVQRYAQQTIQKAVEGKEAKRGIITVINPQNGEIYAMAEYPTFDLNEPFKINDSSLEAIWDTLNSKEKNDALNKMWRNTAINDTYEPGSTFKIITSSAGLEEKAVKTDDTFVCNGYYIAGDRKIKCWRYPRTHGHETFVQGVQNSCNPVFMAVAQRLGAEKFYEYMVKFGFTSKTGVDLPGEAVGIIHKLENIGPVELATMSFGQSFQITPLQLLRAASAIVNGGRLVTPHFAKYVTDEKGTVIKEFEYNLSQQVISKETSDTMRVILESVVSEGTGNKAYIPGYRIGGKTATSEKLPRRSGKYIASFMSFAPADNPQVMAIVLIDEPKGVYYGGTVAGPVMKELMGNILPYFGIEPVYNEKEQELEETKKVVVPDLIGLETEEAKKILKENELEYLISGEGKIIREQFPSKGMKVNIKSSIIITTE
jgi:stage V sporulation protein D (sporulation-specific penicillin-binding protein)